MTGASYWYLDRDDAPITVNLPDENDSFKRVFAVAEQVKNARARLLTEKPEDVFLCPKGEKGCFACIPFEKVLRGEAEYIGIGEMRQDLYMIKA